MAILWVRLWYSRLYNATEHTDLFTTTIVRSCKLLDLRALIAEHIGIVVQHSWDTGSPFL